MQNVALITGASSGIGQALARIHARNGGDLVLFARRKPRLDTLADELRSKYGIDVLTREVDLSRTDQVDLAYAELRQKGIAVDILINNAGFGGVGLFAQQPVGWMHQMLDVNCTALMHLTRLVLPSMQDRGQGRILNIASTAAYLPGPDQAVYYAAKAFVRSFSLALSLECEGTGVSVTVGSPGPTLTEFGTISGMEGCRVYKHAKKPDWVADRLYRAMIRNKREVITDPWMALQIRLLLPFLPIGMILRMSRWFQQKPPS
ncbi:MAG: SDR family oxidoreductase [Opitutales bacterium]|nr:SDR family oxidoreductase [Opitutales bacterium]